MSLAVRFWISVLLALLLGYGGYSLWRVSSMANDDRAGQAAMSPRATPRHLADFSFTDTGGQEFPLRRLEGKVWVASFFFASCPGFCLQMNRTVAELQTELTGQGVQFVSLSVDPEQDTPERLAEYSQMLGADPASWTFLTGDFADVRELGQDVFEVTVTGKADHSDRLILIDRQGQIRGRYSSLDPAQLAQFKRQLKQVLAEPKEPGEAPQVPVAESRELVEEPGEAVTESKDPFEEQAEPGGEQP